MSFCIIISVMFFIMPPVLSRDHCRDRNIAGICIPLSQCEPLMEEIKAVGGGPIPAVTLNRLRDLKCGSARAEPLVCCGSSSTISQKPGLDDDPEDVSNHPNLKLLPRACGTIYSNRIVGGNETDLYEMPWMVILSYDDNGVTKLSCGGTLINERYVLTAAHCVYDLGSRVTLTGAILGEHDLSKDPDCDVNAAGKKSCAPKVVNARIEEVVSHPGYRRQTLFDDIALIRIAQPANFKSYSVGPICLPTTRSLQEDNLDTLFGQVAGWGLRERRTRSSVLLSVAVPFINNAECQAAYKGSPRLYRSQICAGGVQDKGTCSGDSGGPLMYPGLIATGSVRYVQRGIVSFGSKRCGIGGLPGVYTRVSHYMKWILDNMRG